MNGPGRGEGQQRAILCRLIFGEWGRRDTPLLLLLLLLLSSDSLAKGCGTSWGTGEAVHMVPAGTYKLRQTSQ